jgi:exosortase A-associated hydrolase 2
VQPLYFRNSGKSLFGIYHPPLNERSRNCGVVICHPIGHEYIHGYRAVRQLAHQLARVGFTVLRFDYYGCGDSAGDSVEADFSQWLIDVRSAIDEVRSRAVISKLGLIGARLGATLATLVGAERSDIDAMVLWDPVVNGKCYLDELVGQQRKWRSEPFITQPPEPQEQILEVFGFPISAALRKTLEQVDLLKLKSRPAKRVLTLESSRTEHGVQLSRHLMMSGSDSEYRHIPMPRVWGRRAAGDDVVVPTPMMRAIVDWLARLTT